MTYTECNRASGIHAVVVGRTDKIACYSNRPVKVNQYIIPYLCSWLAASCIHSWSSSNLVWYCRLACIHGEGKRARVTSMCVSASTDVQSQVALTTAALCRQSPVATVKV